MSVELLDHCRRCILFVAVACLCVLLGGSSGAVGAERLF